MSDPVSTASAIFGIISFVGQAGKCLRSLRRLQKFNRDRAPQELELLRVELEALDPLIAHVRQVTSAEEPLGDLCADIHRRLVQNSTDLAESRRSSAAGKSILSAVKTTFRTDLRDGIEDAEKALDQLLSLLVILQLKIVEQSVSCVRQADQELSSKIEDLRQEFVRAQNSAETSQKPTTQVTKRLIGVVKPRPADCSVRQCFCSCHLAWNSSGRFWGVQYTSISTLLGSCNVASCTARRSGLSLRLSLSRYGIPLAINMSLELLSKARTFSIHPTLSFQTVVRYTSPGFDALVRCQQGLITAKEACNRFWKLAQNDRYVKGHVDSNGKDYIEFLTVYPWRNQDDQFEILVFLVIKLSCDISTKYDQSMLSRCARWIGEGRHMELLETLIAQGLDPGQFHAPQFEQWPCPCSPDWIAEHWTNDPFFLEYVGILAAPYDGFAGTTWLQRAMFHESAEVVHELMNRTPELDRDRNFLGQTPLHVAIDRKLYFEELLNAGHYVDVTDNCGITPLMYAAAMGETSFAESLLRRGADPFIISDQKYHERDFVAFAMGRKQWTFLLDLFENIQELYEEHVMHDFATRILMQFMSRVWNPNFDDRLQFCSRMTRFCKNINFVFDDPHHNVENMTLMHCIRDVEEGKVLVQAGYDGFDRANSKGHVPLATIASLSNAPAFTFCLQNTDINANPTIRRHVTLQLVASLDPISHENMWDAVDSIRSYLRATSGCSDTDGCTCPCGPQGCGVSSMFDISFGIFYTARRVSVVWTLEWLLQVKAFHGEEAAKNVALGLIRRLVVDKLGIKHTCCHDGHGLDVQRPSPWEKTDTNIANGGFALQVQDEDVIEKLEAEMSDLSDRDLPSLFNICMKLVKQKYDTHLQEFQEESRQRQREKHTSCSFSFEVDQLNDKFHYGYSMLGSPPMSHSMHQPVVNYTLWLEHDLVRRSVPPLTAQVEEEYQVRLGLLLQFVSVMKLKVEDIATDLESKEPSETRTEKLDKKQLAAHFRQSVEQRRGMVPKLHC